MSYNVQLTKDDAFLLITVKLNQLITAMDMNRGGAIYSD